MIFELFIYLEALIVSNGKNNLLYNNISSHCTKHVLSDYFKSLQDSFFLTFFMVHK